MSIRFIPFEIDLDTQASSVTRAVSLYANSDDVLEIQFYNGTVPCEEINGTDWKVGVKIYTGTDSRSPQTVFRRPLSVANQADPVNRNAPPSTTGITYPSVGIAHIPIQIGDFVDGDGMSEVPVTMEIWVYEPGSLGDGKLRILAAVFRVTVVDNMYMKGVSTTDIDPEVPWT